MSKFTVVVNDKGELVAAQAGSSDPSSQEAGLLAGPGQMMHVVEVPDDVASLTEPADFEKAIKPHLRRR